MLFLVRRYSGRLPIGVGIETHELSLLELLAPDEVPTEGRSHLRHDGGSVLLHGVVARLGQVTHEAKNSDPQSKCGLGG